VRAPKAPASSGGATLTSSFGTGHIDVVPQRQVVRAQGQVHLGPAVLFEECDEGENATAFRDNVPGSLAHLVVVGSFDFLERCRDECPAKDASWPA